MLVSVRFVAFVPMVIAARIRRVERRTIERLRDAGADRPERAILLEPGGPIERFVYRRLERAAALKPAAGGRYYLYAAGYDGFRGRRRRRAALVLGAAAVVFVALYLGGVLK